MCDLDGLLRLMRALLYPTPAPIPLVYTAPTLLMERSW